MDRSRLEVAVRAFSVVIGLFTLGVGIWAFASPASFFQRLATFEPYNRHFLHDVGAFQAGLGVVLIVAPFWRNAVGVALAGYGTAAVLHAVSHVVDADLGGRATDPLALGVLAALVVAALVAWASRSPQREDVR